MLTGAHATYPNPLLFLVVTAHFFQAAYGTNEGSYRYGFNQAISDYETCYQGWTTDYGCALSGQESPNECYVGAGPGNVTNSTACFHGYMNGWKHWCKGNTKDCAQLTADDILPGSLLSDNKTALAGLKVLSYIVGTWNFVNGAETSATRGTITFKGDGHDQNSGRLLMAKLYTQ